MSGSEAALVVGAHGGIGGAIAEALARDGFRLVLAARDEAALERLATDLRVRGTECLVQRLDVTDDDHVAEVVGRAAEFGGGDLGVAVNNVGVSHRPTPLGELDLADIDRVLGVSLRGVMVAMRAELRVLRDGGSLINIASTAGLDAAPGMSAYVAAKHALVGLTRTAAVDYAARQIRVNAIAPGPTASGRLAELPDAALDRVAAAVPLGRLGRPEEVAAVVSWLASPNAGFVTGTVVTIDGGKLAGRA